MRYLILSAAIALVGIAPAFAARVPGPELNSCHGGQCSWSITLGSALVRRDSAGALFRLSLRGGAAAEGSRRIRWNRAPHIVFVFCSSAPAGRHPARARPFAGRCAGLRRRPAAIRGKQRESLHPNLSSRGGLVRYRLRRPTWLSHSGCRPGDRLIPARGHIRLRALSASTSRPSRLRSGAAPRPPPMLRID